MKKHIKKIIIIVLLAVVALGVYHFFMKEKPALILLQTDEVTQGDVTTEVTATGSVQPVDEVEVGTQVSGVGEQNLCGLQQPSKERTAISGTRQNQSTRNGCKCYCQLPISS